MNLMDAVKVTDSIRSLIFVTSDKCYKNKEVRNGYRETDELGGRDPYSASKAAAELVFLRLLIRFYQKRKFWSRYSSCWKCNWRWRLG